MSRVYRGKFLNFDVVHAGEPYNFGLSQHTLVESEVYFEKLKKSTVYSGTFWFTVPRNVVRFANYRGSNKKSNYVTRDEEAMIHEMFDKLNMIVVGFLHDGSVFPVKIINSMYEGLWTETMDLFKRHNFNIVFKNNYPTCSYPDNTCFVINKTYQFIN